ncbi:MAG: aldo/keto reductase [Bacilli bacterium]|jgi:predicted aldo/keto reductase-like oxidoreductase|nr:aldo/keto reductase [Bacilli bacterium]
MKKLGFGLMRLPLLNNNDFTKIDIDLVNKCVDKFIESGYTYFDTAYIYHEGFSEKIVKECLVNRHDRNTFTVATKMPVFMVKEFADYQRIFEEQLDKTGLSYFDYYLLHSLNALRYDNYLVKKDGFNFLQEIKKKGLAKKVGFSFHDNAQTLQRILADHPEIDFVQLQINYADWDNDAIESRKCYEVACKYHIPVIVMEPVKGGALSKLPIEAETLLKNEKPNASLANWAFRYVASLDNVMMILSGMSNYEQIIDNINTFDHLIKLNNKEQELIKKVVKIIEDKVLVACTSCRYCIDGCPQHINIPEFFALYNNQHIYSLAPAMFHYYDALSEEGNKASACIECKACENICPQHLSIINHLKGVAKVFENR